MHFPPGKNGNSGDLRWSIREAEKRSITGVRIPLGGCAQALGTPPIQVSAPSLDLHPNRRPVVAGQSSDDVLVTDELILLLPISRSSIS